MNDPANDLWEVLQGDVRARLRDIPDESIQTCVTSPPYWGLRDYGVEGQLGLEKTPEEYVSNMVDVFRDVRRTLRNDGTLWLNLGDSYAGSWGNQGRKAERGTQRPINAPMMQNLQPYPDKKSNTGSWVNGHPTMKPKDLVGIPWMVAFALRADGWYLRSDIIWHKPNPMPESVTDRPTKAHEYLFLMSKSKEYYYDHDAIKEPVQHPKMLHKSDRKSDKAESAYFGNAPTNLGRCGTSEDGLRNRRTVWTITPKPFKGAHFATMPPDLVEPCILAGSKPGDVVLDPFNGAGTTGLVALKHGRLYLGIELNPEYIEITRARLTPEAQAA